jgi:hypothetical protein
MSPSANACLKDHELGDSQKDWCKILNQRMLCSNMAAGVTSLCYSAQSVYVCVIVCKQVCECVYAHRVFTVEGGRLHSLRLESLKLVFQPLHKFVVNKL